MTSFENIGKALRWLRTQRAKKQREIAKAAKITPAMLSAYETGKHKPSLDTAERVLGALGCDVVDLTRALQVVGESDRAMAGPHAELTAALAAPIPAEGRLGELLEQSFGEAGLAPQEKQVLGSLVPALVQLIRYMKR